MGAYPEPQYRIRALHTESSVSQTDANGPESADPLQMQRRVGGVVEKELKATVRGSTHAARQSPVAVPELGSSTMLQSSVVRPAA
jgi:hypothetical protein